VKELSKPLVEELVKKALEARKNAYAPYSNFLVGAAVLTKDGQIYSGCNVENASYGLSNCGERTAIFKAVSEGAREIEAVAIVGNGDKYCSPCGACRQVIAEFGEDIQVIMANEVGQYIVKDIEELLPGAFTGRDLA
jgi:cytidine deaminase